jgi:hypothetical protein
VRTQVARRRSCSFQKHLGATKESLAEARLPRSPTQIQIQCADHRQSSPQRCGAGEAPIFYYEASSIKEQGMDQGIRILRCSSDLKIRIRPEGLCRGSQTMAPASHTDTATSV